MKQSQVEVTIQVPVRKDWVQDICFKFRTMPGKHILQLNHVQRCGIRWEFVWLDEACRSAVVDKAHRTTRRLHPNHHPCPNLQTMHQSHQTSCTLRSGKTVRPSVGITLHSGDRRTAAKEPQGRPVPLGAKQTPSNSNKQQQRATCLSSVHRFLIDFSSFIIIHHHSSSFIIIHGMISLKSIDIQFMASSRAIRLTGGASRLAANPLENASRANLRCLQSLCHSLLQFPTLNRN